MIIVDSRKYDIARWLDNAVYEDDGASEDDVSYDLNADL